MGLVAAIRVLLFEQQRVPRSWRLYHRAMLLSAVRCIWLIESARDLQAYVFGSRRVCQDTARLVLMDQSLKQS